MTGQAEKTVHRLLRLWPIPVAGVGYSVVLKTWNLSVPCMFRLLTGLKCPGCGITHMLMYLCQGRFSAACRSNQYLFVTLPFLSYEVVYALICYLWERHISRRNSRILYGYIAGLLAFGVLRNLPELVGIWRYISL